MITAPFKFDVPSPDDLVSKGLRSSKAVPKGTFLNAFETWGWNFCYELCPGKDRMATFLILSLFCSCSEDKIALIEYQKTIVKPSNTVAIKHTELQICSHWVLRRQHEQTFKKTILLVSLAIQMEFEFDHWSHKILNVEMPRGSQSYLYPEFE